MVKGTVSISLEDYHSLLEAAQNSQEFKDNTLLTFKEVQVFLSFLASRADIEKHIEEFNRQSKTSKIVFEGSKAKIEKKND